MTEHNHALNCLVRLRLNVLILCEYFTFKPIANHSLQAPVLQAFLLFILLPSSPHSQVFAIREAAISIIGRLAARNPAYVMPSLRKTLIQLLTELQYSGETRNRYGGRVKNTHISFKASLSKQETIA
jgi:hypothetical protein